MRIAFLTVSSEMGGSERSLVELLRGAAPPPAGLDVRRRPAAGRPAGGAGARRRRIGRDPADARRAGALWRVTLRRTRRARRRAAASGGCGGRIRAETPHSCCASSARDVIHSNGLKLHVLAAWIADAQTPLVWHIHEYVTPRRLSRALLRRSAGRVAVAVANSRSVARDLAIAVGPRLRVETIYNGIDLDEFSPSRGPRSCRSRCARRMAGGAGRHGPHRPGGDVRPLEGTRRLPSRASRSSIPRCPCAPTSSAAPSTTRPAASTRSTNFGG